MYQDAEAGQVTLEDGTVYTGDLIIGADGIHVRHVAHSLLQFLMIIPVSICTVHHWRGRANGQYRSKLFSVLSSRIQDAG